MSSFNLRPHHGLCIQFFEGKGYSPEFVRHMREMIFQLHEYNPYIALTVGADVLCSHCPHCIDNVCECSEKVQRFDKAVLQYCNLSEGSEMPWNDFQSIVKESILKKGLLAEICGDCQWFGICGKSKNNL
ncbi:MAG TPA: DUF1284 domain-containing protein [Ruminococcus sp.]|nr:DUF1284 domain-containing protein [Ruminococcus sp.]